MSAREPIAIVRMSAVLPGAASADAFWDNVKNARSAVTDVPEGRWEVAPEDIHDEGTGANPAVDRTYARRGGFVRDFALDTGRVKLDRALLMDLDPLFHWVLQLGHEVTEGLRVPRERTGVSIANLALPSDAFAQLGRTGWRRILRLALGNRADALPEPEHAPHAWNHFHEALPAGLLAHALDLQGGSLGLDAACASSLYAIKLACDALQEGRVDAMVAGGIARTDHLCLAVGFSQLKAISRAGHSRPFDARADGLIPGEGCGLFYLRRLSDALASREPILGVIKGIGLSNDGKGRGVLVPMSEGQVRSMRAAYADAGVEPHTVGLVECHATGTPVGDATEVSSLRAVWGAHAPEHGTAIGSAKSNIGHLLTAAGAAGLIKAVSAVRDGVLPPTINYEKPSAGTDLQGSPLYVNTQLRPWVQASGPRRAGVSAFGFGGCNAHLIVEEAPSARPAFTLAPRPARHKAEPLAVVAMHSRFGEAVNVDAYRVALFEGRSILQKPPAGRWFGLEENADAMRPLPGAYITEMAVPELMRLKIPPAEMDRMLPQQLLSLLVADEMLADNAVLARVKDRSRVGVIVGMSMESDAGDYAFRWSTQRDARHSPAARAEWLRGITDAATRKINAEPVLGFLANLVANRISSRFDLGGPSLALSAEDAGALKALETAATMLRRGDVDAMVVGGVDLPGDIRTLWLTDGLQGWSHTGEVKPFDAAADGSLPAEGAGMVVLKRLSDATRDGDTILSVIRGVGSAGDGAAGTPGKPSARGAQLSLRRALEESDVPARSVSLVVAHGSGRPAEDAAEVDALHQVFGRGHTEPHAALFSTKPWAGHAGAASGMQGIIAAILALRHRAIPAGRGPDALVDADAWKGSPFYVSRKARPWMVDRDESPRRAMVGGMSVDGNHVHVLVEEGPHKAVTTALGPAEEALFIFRAPHRDALAEQLEAFAVEAAAHADLDRLARERAARHVRGQSGMVCSVVASSQADLQKKLQKAARELRAGTPTLMDIHGVFFTDDPMARHGGVAFIFPGAGNAYAGMAREVVLRFPDQVEDFERKTVAPRSRCGEYWLNPRELVKRKVTREEQRHPVEMIWAGGFYTQMLADVLRGKLSLHPDAAVGYSLGESSGLFALNTWRGVDDSFDRMTHWPLLNTEIVGEMRAILRAWESWGVDVTPYRGKTFWSTYMVQATPEAVRRAMEGERLCHISIINAPEEVVIAGETSACERVIARLGVTFFPTPFPAAVHVPECSVTETEYRAMNSHPVFPPAGVTYYSSGRGEPYECTSENVTQSIIDQAVNTVDFPKLIRRVWDDGIRVFVEVGPRGSCTRWIGRILEGRPFCAVATDRKGRSEFVNLLHMAAQVAAHGVDVDLAGLYSCASDVPQVVLPASARRFPTSRALQLPAPPAHAATPSITPRVARPAPVFTFSTPPPPPAMDVAPPPPSTVAVRRAGPPMPPPPPRVAVTAPVVPPILCPPPVRVRARQPDTVMTPHAAPPVPPVTPAMASSSTVPAALPSTDALAIQSALAHLLETHARMAETHRAFLAASAFGAQKAAQVLAASQPPPPGTGPGSTPPGGGGNAGS